MNRLEFKIKKKHLDKYNKYRTKFSHKYKVVFALVLLFSFFAEAAIAEAYRFPDSWSNKPTSTRSYTDLDGKFSVSGSFPRFRGSCPGDVCKNTRYKLYRYRNGSLQRTVNVNHMNFNSPLRHGRYRFKLKVTYDVEEDTGSGFDSYTESRFNRYFIDVFVPAHPSVSNISNKTINEDNDTGVIPFGISDADTPPNRLRVSATSSNQALVPNNLIYLAGGTDNTRTIKVIPLTNKYGSTTITLTVSDGVSPPARDTFKVTVRSVNDRPTVTAIGHRTINEDANTGNINFRIADVESSTRSLRVTATSSNTSLVANSSRSLRLSGSAGSRNLRVTPTANKFGTAYITVKVSDGVLSATRRFRLTVRSVNDRPTMSAIDNWSMDAGSKELNFRIGDIETSSNSLRLTVNSSNTSLLPTNNDHLRLLGSGNNRRIKVTPRPGYTGTATVTVTVSDGSASTSKTFTVNTSNSVSFRYDALGRLIRSEHPNALVDRYEYDKAGNRKSVSSTRN